MSLFALWLLFATWADLATHTKYDCVSMLCFPPLNCFLCNALDDMNWVVWMLWKIVNSHWRILQIKNTFNSWVEENKKPKFWMNSSLQDRLYRDFLHTLVYPPSPSSPHPNPSPDDPAYTHHNHTKSVVYLGVALGGVLSLSFAKCVRTWIQ